MDTVVAKADFADLEESLLDFQKFHTAIKLLCTRCAHSVGIWYDLDVEKLENVHADWLNLRESWLSSKFACEKTSELNHTKTFAILLHCLARTDFVEFYVRSTGISEREDIYYDVAGGGLRENLLDGQHIYIGWLAVSEFIDQYEMYRDDKATEYVNPINRGFEHEFITFLKNGEHNSFAIYLTLYALFLRDDK